MKKIIALVLALTLLACVLLPGCQPSTEQPDNNNGSKIPTKEVTVVFYHTMGQTLQGVLHKYIEEFNKLYPNIHIDDRMIGNYDDLRDQVITELQSGKHPALAYCYPDHVASYLRSKKVIDLNDYIKDEEVGLTQAQIDDFIQGYYVEGQQFGSTDNMYTLPFSKSTEVMYYNITFFEKHGLKVPDHWFAKDANDETSLEYVIKKIKEIEPTSIPLGYDSEANWFITMTEQLKTPYTTAAEKIEDRFTFVDDRNMEFLDKFREWTQAGLLTTQTIYKGYTSGLFTNTKASEDGTVIHSYISIGSSAGAKYQCPAKQDNGEYPFEVGIAPIPQADENNKKVISQGPSICMLKQKDSAVNDAAWIFVKYLLTNTAFCAEFSMSSGYVPVLKSSFQLDAYKTFMEEATTNLEGIPALSAKVCMEQESAYFTSPAFVGSSDARDQVGELLVAYISAKEGTTREQLKQLFVDAYNRCVTLNK